MINTKPPHLSSSPLPLVGPMIDLAALFDANGRAQQYAVINLLRGPLPTLDAIARRASPPEGPAVHPHEVFFLRSSRLRLLRAWKAGTPVDDATIKALATNTQKQLKRISTNREPVEMRKALEGLRPDHANFRAEWALCQSLKSLFVIAAQAELTWKEVCQSDGIQWRMADVLNYWLAVANRKVIPEPEALHLDPEHQRLCATAAESARKLYPVDFAFTDLPSGAAGKRQEPPARLPSFGQPELHGATPMVTPEKPAPSAAEVVAYRLLGSAAHDFNNLFTVIVGYLEMVSGQLDELGAGVPTSPVSNLQQSIAHVQQASAAAADLTQHLLSVSRGTSGQPALLNLNEFVESLLAVTKKWITARATLEVDLQRVPAVKAVPVELTRVGMNLIKNALEAMPDEGAGPNAIGFKLWTENGRVILDVSDTGCGIAKDRWGSVFILGNTSRAAEGGTGQGLFHSRAAIERDGGTLEIVRSSTAPENHGTTFRITLPAYVAKREPEVPAKKSPPAA